MDPECTRASLEGRKQKASLKTLREKIPGKVNVKYETKIISLWPILYYYAAATTIISKTDGL